ncbi:hypothetical protein BN978_02042 [Mycolicibacterium mageritense DSM 44476 = CIP 104973]|nr:hypothetical protein BN978_02042 [Mycolicibacterium mageritense DSM 44476 = CIP 104973]
MLSTAPVGMTWPRGPRPHRHSSLGPHPHPRVRSLLRRWRHLRHQRLLLPPRLRLRRRQLRPRSPTHRLRSAQAIVLRIFRCRPGHKEHRCRRAAKERRSRQEAKAHPFNPGPKVLRYRKAAKERLFLPVPRASLRCPEAKERHWHRGAKERHCRRAARAPRFLREARAPRCPKAPRRRPLPFRRRFRPQIRALRSPECVRPTGYRFLTAGSPCRFRAIRNAMTTTNTVEAASVGVRRRARR